MKAIIFSILYIVLSPNVNASDVFGVQSWELIEDQDSNGWIDSGDKIKCFVQITVYTDDEVEKVKFENHFKNDCFSLVSGSVAFEKGQLKTGNSPGDSIIEIEEISLGQPWEKTMISFEVLIGDVGIVDHIANHSILSTRHNTITTNEVVIPLLKHNVTSSQITFSFVHVTLILILLSGFIFWIFKKGAFRLDYAK